VKRLPGSLKYSDPDRRTRGLGGVCHAGCRHHHCLQTAHARRRGVKPSRADGADAGFSDQFDRSIAGVANRRDQLQGFAGTRVALAGLTEIETGGFSVITAEAALDESAKLVACRGDRFAVQLMEAGAV